MSKIDNFPYSTPILTKIWECSLWSRSVMLRSTESERIRLIVVKLFSQNSSLPIWPRYLNITDRRTDNLSLQLIPRSATLRAVKTYGYYLSLVKSSANTYSCWCRCLATSSAAETEAVLLTESVWISSCSGWAERLHQGEIYLSRQRMSTVCLPVCQSFCVCRGEDSGPWNTC